MSTPTTKIGYQAFGNCVVINPNIKEKTDGGIYVPDAVKDTNVDIFPEVMSVGEKVEHIKVGDRVSVFNTAQPTAVTIGDVKYFVIKDYDIMGKLVTQVLA